MRTPTIIRNSLHFPKAMFLRRAMSLSSRKAILRNIRGIPNSRRVSRRRLNGPGDEVGS